jgi:hypothetical protein
MEDRTVCGLNGDGVDVRIPVIAYRHGIQEYEIDGLNSESAVGDATPVFYLESCPREGRVGTSNDLYAGIFIEIGVGAVCILAFILIASGLLAI